METQKRSKRRKNISRSLRVAAGQIGPIYKDEPRVEIVERLIALLEEAAIRKVELICYPECALSTFFPRSMLEWNEVDRYFDKSMPNPSVQPLFDRAKELGIGFCLGYAELDGNKRYNTSILVNKDGKIIGKYRKSHTKLWRIYGIIYTLRAKSAIEYYARWVKESLGPWSSELEMYESPC